MVSGRYLDSQNLDSVIHWRHLDSQNRVRFRVSVRVRIRVDYDCLDFDRNHKKDCQTGQLCKEDAMDCRK